MIKSKRKEKTPVFKQKPAVFCAQARIWSFAVNAALGPRGGQGRKDSPARFWNYQQNYFVSSIYSIISITLHFRSVHN